MTTKTADSNSAWLLLLWLGLPLAVWLSDWVPFRSDLTIYEVACAKTNDDGSCPASQEVPGRRTIYQPNRDTQSVVFWVEGEAPLKYSNCAIVDALNWSCPGELYSRQMVDGVLDSRQNNDGWYPRHVSKAKWWWTKFKKI